MTFHVGQRVVCVDADALSVAVPWFRADLDMDGLTKGRVYTIRKIGTYSTHLADIPLVWLHEIIRPMRGGIANCYGEVGYAPCRFRPLIERKTDSGVAILKKIARDVTERKPVKISERA
jgi:hypothetical protein